MNFTKSQSVLYVSAILIVANVLYYFGILKIMEVFFSLIVCIIYLIDEKKIFKKENQPEREKQE